MTGKRSVAYPLLGFELLSQQLHLGAQLRNLLLHLLHVSLSRLEGNDTIYLAVQNNGQLWRWITHSPDRGNQVAGTFPPIYDRSPQYLPTMLGAIIDI